jgi:predicted  nucleic acid-binding Zn-ribbon protein
MGLPLALIHSNLYNFFILMSSPFHLYQLQKIDTQSDQLERRMKEIQVLISIDEKSTLLTSEILELESILKNEGVHSTQIETSIQQRKIKLEQANSVLYGGKVVNSKELLDLQTEIESHMRTIIKMEDELMGSLNHTEQTQEKIKSTQNLLQKSQAEFDTYRKKLLSENDVNAKNFERLKVERQVAITQINQEMLSIYENIRQKKKGIAVSIIKDQSCSACGHELTPAEVQTARTSPGLSYCSSCSRILFSE